MVKWRPVCIAAQQHLHQQQQQQLEDLRRREESAPDNERRKMRREAWLQRRTVSRPDLVSTAATAAAATAAATALEESLSSGVYTSAVAATSGQEAGQAGGPAAPGTALTVPVMTAATPPRAWAWEKRDGLVVIARRLQMKPQGSPEMARGPEDGCELNLSISSWSEDRELDDKCSGLGSPLTYAEAAAKVPTAQAAAAQGPAAPGETASRAEEGTEPVYRPPCQHLHPGQSISLATLGGSCVLFVLPAIEKFGMLSAQTVIV